MNELTITIRREKRGNANWIVFTKDDFKLELKETFVKSDYKHALEIFEELFDKYYLKDEIRNKK